MPHLTIGSKIPSFTAQTRDGEFQFDSLRGKNVVLTGCPSHKPFSEISRAELLKEFGLDEGKKTVLILGGSQGSRRLNEVFVQTVPELRSKVPLQVIHLCGKDDYETLRKQYAHLGVPFALFAFFEAMERAYPVADLVVARAGAVSVTELIRFHKSSILIPYPHAGEHQKKNAEVLAQAGVGEFIDQKDLTVARLTAAVERRVAQRHSLQEWEQHFGELLPIDPAVRLAEEVIRLKL